MTQRHVLGFISGGESMPQYTTGELAKLCDVSVRTVQFYDSKDLLKPTALTEGGRRLYSESDLKVLRLICLLKSLGLTLDSIKGILSSQTPSKVLLLLLDEQLKRVDVSIDELQKQKKEIEIVKDNIRNTEEISVNSINGIEEIMKANHKLKAVHGILLVIGILMDIIELIAIVLWIINGWWQAFVAMIPVVIFLGCLLTGLYYKKSAYICPECNAKFRPKFWNFVFAKHTPKTRKLICTSCGHDGYCVETYADKK
jgi:DNA-binding transcriptional MerR regulator/DNA-directed RNA polymerase subunit RPC12/RpoP